MVKSRNSSQLIVGTTAFRASESIPSISSLKQICIRLVFLNSHPLRRYPPGVRMSVLWLTIAMVVSMVNAEEVVLQKKQSSTVISNAEELARIVVGPMNKYELMNSLPTVYSTTLREHKESLLQYYDSNLYDCAPFPNLD